MFNVLKLLRTIIATLTFGTLVICTTANADHPSLFFSSSDLPALRARAAASEAGTDPFYTDLYTEIKIDCRSTYGPSATFPNSTRKRNAQALKSHAALYLLDPDGRALEDRYQSATLFFDYFFEVLNWSDSDGDWSNFFGDTHFDTTDFLIALCIGYDWHYDKFSSSQRTDIVNKLADRADYLVNNADEFFDIPAELDGTDYSYLHTFKVLRNRDMIPVSALGMVAYTLQGEVDESRRQKWLNKLDEVLQAWSTHVSLDGMSHEGYAYHEYLMQSFLPMLAVRSTKTGINQFTHYPYVNKHPLFSIYSWIPGGDRSFIAPMPFADCGTEPPSDMRTLIALTARWLKGDNEQLDCLANWMQYRGPSIYNDIPNNSYSRVDPMQFFWADDSIQMKSPTDLDLPTFHYFPERGAFVWRSGWDDMAMYFSMTCGPLIGGHQQPEMGNFAIYKGGAPFIAHHGYTTWRRTEDYNMMIINGLGSHGEQDSDGSATTEPQPSSRWASIQLALGDPDYFNIMTDLQPSYRESSLTLYTREFVGIGERIFVRDRVRSSSSIKYDHLLQAFCTNHPSKPATESTALDIDSNRSANPWAGSGPSWTVTPRSEGPFTSSMSVADLSAFAWPGSTSVAKIKNEDGSYTSRGYKLTRTKTMQSGSSLMGFYFPTSGETISAWPDPSQAEGFRISRNGSVRALTAWTESNLSNAYGLTLNGMMGGVDLDQTAFWGRDASVLSYDGITYFNASAPVSFYANTGSESGRIRIVSAAQASVQIYHPQQPAKVYIDSQALSSSAWNWSGNVLTITVPASPDGTLIQTANSAENAVTPSHWMFLN